jgi:uncharacterized protein (TIGR00269 family)
MKVYLNGKAAEIKNYAYEALWKSGIDPAFVVIVKNGKVIHESEALKNNDKIRTVKAVSGGSDQIFGKKSQIRKAEKCRCGKKAVYYRVNEGRWFCAACLARQVEKRFRRTLSKNLLIKKNDKIGIAMSGGMDSQALAFLMKKNFDNIIEISGISVEEGTKTRKVAIEKAKLLCKNLGIPHNSYSFKKEFGTGLDEIKTEKYCTYCGVFRRYILNKRARELGFDRIAVGHNMEDEVQSIVMNLMKGDFGRMQRLGADPILINDKKFVRRIKPMRDIPKKEVAIFAVHNKIPFSDAGCPYAGDNIRRDVQMLVNEMEKKYPGIKYNIINFYDRLRPMITKNVNEKITYCSKCGEPGGRICKCCLLLEIIRQK